MSKQFTKSDFKDGMVVTLKNGRKNYIVLQGKQIQDLHGYCDWDIDTNFTDDLACDLYDNFSIMKVEYMGEVLWERKEYVSFDVARKSNKNVRFNATDSNTPYRDIMYLVGKTCDYGDKYTFNRMLCEDLWEIEP